jgi:chaperonin GroES
MPAATAERSVKEKDKPAAIIRPVGDQIVVRRAESPDQTDGGIVLPQRAKDRDRPAKGIVFAVGRGYLQNGQIFPLEIERGDEVHFSEGYGGAQQIEVDGEEFVVLREGNVLAVVKRG